MAIVLALGLAAAVGGVLGGPTLAETIVNAPSAVWQPGAAAKAPPVVLDAVAAQVPAPTPDGVAAALQPLLSTPGLGGRAAVSVVDPATGQALFTSGADTTTVPASVAKVVTGAAVLAARGPNYRIITRVVEGEAPGDVLLLGAGDATLASGPGGLYPGAARLDLLAAQVRAVLGDTPPTRVVYDSTAFRGNVLGPGWDPDVTSAGFGGPITALMTDGGRTNPKQRNSTRAGQPDLAAAQLFARLLGLPTTAVTTGRAKFGARELGRVESPPILRMVEIMLTESDNVLAETLARQVALAKNFPPSFEGATDAVRTTLEGLGLPLTGFGLVDGSGLSRQDRLAPSLLTAILAMAASPDRLELRSLYSGLPVAGYSGTLAQRYRGDPQAGAGVGVVRAKTGRLTGVSSIAGVAVTMDGRPLVFAFIADQVRDNELAPDVLDRIATALAQCGCR